MNRFLAIALKELRQLRRDRLTLAMMAMLPVVQLLLFGYAINTDVRHVPTVVWDQDHSAASREIVQTLEATGFYDIEGRVFGYPEIERAMRSGRARVALVVPPGYEASLAAQRPSTLQLVVDGTDPQIVASALNTVSSLVALRSAAITDARLPLY